MGRVGKLRRQLTVDRVSGAADLGVKFAGIVVAVGAIAVVFFGPKIEITTARQTFIDRDALQRQYRDHPDGVPPVVVGVARTYNRDNQRDLLSHENATIDKVTGRELCSGPEADLLARVFPDADCDGSGFVTVGHGHFWERLLIRRVHALPDAAFDDEVQLASDAVGRMYASQYRQVRAIVSNNGHTRAVNVNVRVPIGFSPLTEGQSISPFTLGPDEAPVERFYRTAAGVPEVNRNASSEPASAAVDRFGVDWERDENAQTGVVLWVGVAFLVLWIAIVFNDNRLRARRDVEGDAAPSE